MKKSKTKSLASNSGELTVAVISIHSLLISGLIAQAVVIWYSTFEEFFPGVAAFQQLAGTCAEIIAGLYGITMASYTFFLSRMDSLVNTDLTLDYVVKNLKIGYRYLIWYITFTIAATLGICLLIMYYPATDNLIPSYFYRLMCHEFLLFWGFAVTLILYYSVSVISPSTLDKHATRLKRKLSADPTIGNGLAFLANYDRIAKLSYSFLPRDVVCHLRDSKGLHFERILDLLNAYCPHLRPVISDLIRLHRYYSCAVNCTQLSVSHEMCDLAQRILQFMEHSAPANQIYTEETT